MSAMLQWLSLHSMPCWQHAPGSTQEPAQMDRLTCTPAPCCTQLFTVTQQQAALMGRPAHLIDTARDGFGSLSPLLELSLTLLL